MRCTHGCVARQILPRSTLVYIGCDFRDIVFLFQMKQKKKIYEIKAAKCLLSTP